MRRFPVFIIPILLLAACGGQGDVQGPASGLDAADSTTVQRPVWSDLEARLKAEGLVDIQSLDSSIRVDLKYSGTDNFVGIDVYGDMNRAYLQPEVAAKLVNAQRFLQEQKPGYGLVVYDAVRPLFLQQIFWDSVKVPRAERGKYVANPKNGGSLHNYGAAVDVSIVDPEGKELDMGCAFDHFGDLAAPIYESRFLESGELTEVQVNNRKLLRSVMYKAGFFNIQTEWWHFNACTRDHAMSVYKLLQ